MSVTYFNERPVAQEQMPNLEAHLRNLAQTANSSMRGLDNTSFQITLAAGATSTTIQDPRLSLQTSINLMPTTADAAALIPSIWITCTKGMAVINHGAAAGDCIYTASIAG